MIKVAVIDDEQLAVNNLIHILKQIPDLEIVGGFTEIDPFLTCLSKNDIQLVFLDIEMPEITGLNLAARIIEEHKDIEVVFATAYNQYAVEAFELNAVDYILKPLSANRIKKTIERVKERLLRDKSVVGKKIFIRCLGGFDILVDGKVIPFTLSKAKEILAYLINNMGKSLGWMTIADDIWPDAYDDKKLMNNFHVASFSLRTFLNENGISEIFDYSRNIYRVDIDKFTCDFLQLHDTYNEYKKTKEINTHPHTFKTGEYLENLPYIWAMPMAEKVERMIQEMMVALRKK